MSAPVAPARLAARAGSLLRTRSRGGGRVGEADPPRLTYRPELDAIRGVAVLIVLFQHFGLVGVGPDNHRAGQVGVTLFFVLSGYLITSLLLAERQETGRVSLPRFYARRMRRLFPALAFMVGVVWLAGLSGDPIPALTYTSNIYQHFDLGQIGAYQHTWTLGIEEQFYLIWPALFAVLPRRALVPALVVAIFVSVLAMPWTGILQRNDALLGGALLAVTRFRVPGWMGVVGWVGLLALAFVPGPVDHAVLVGAAGVSVPIVGAPGPIDRARSLVRLGTISYGVYLWSFPIALLVQPVQVHVSRIEAVIWTMGGIVATIVMAGLSARFVERRWRVGRAGVEPDRGAGSATELHVNLERYVHPKAREVHGGSGALH